ncbi:MAG: single-stranded-DNA-specific exonuclease RecJ [Armatimonadetes bacterium]|nr:single-stranded-DNA-specific exonuclease RecJ [Armatimonadota bacterium]
MLTSSTGKRWVLPDIDPVAVEKLVKDLGIHRLTAKVLVQRGYTSPAQAERFLNPSLDDLGEPELLPDYRKAVDEILRAKESGDLIFVHGDYDVDGVTSAAIFDRFLKKIGCNAHTHVPHRTKEGYGINMALVHEAKERGAKVFLTCDCGIGAHDQVEAALAHGMRVVVTDHHELKETLPNAQAVVNPHRSDSRYPFSDLSGAGVVFRLCEGIARELDPKSVDSYRRNYLDLAALGTIADVMPLIGDNRIIAKFGLERLSESKKKGLMALKEVSEIKGRVASYDVGFKLGPRLNAAGRIDDAALALQLLLAEDDKVARDLALELDRHNTDRRMVQDQMIEEAVALVESLPSLPNALLIFKEDWHPGVVGIVAGKLKEKFNRPAFVGCIEPESGKGKASGRSIPGLNLAAMIQNYPAIVSGGGHAMAAGIAFDLNNVDVISQAFNQYVAQLLKPEDFVPAIELTADVDNEEIDFGILEELEKLQPFGMANPKPVFYASGVTLNSVRAMGDGSHANLTLLTDSKRTYRGVAFGMYDTFSGLQQGAKTDLVFEPQINEYQGNRTIQWRIADVRPLQQAELLL